MGGETLKTHLIFVFVFYEQKVDDIFVIFNRVNIEKHKLWNRYRINSNYF